MRKNITAFTETHVSAPGYVSVNSESEGVNSITVRTRTSGNAGVINLSDAELIGMAYDILAALEKPTLVVDGDKPKKTK